MELSSGKLPLNWEIQQLELPYTKWRVPFIQCGQAIIVSVHGNESHNVVSKSLWLMTISYVSSRISPFYSGTVTLLNIEFSPSSDYSIQGHSDSSSLSVLQWQELFTVNGHVHWVDLWFGLWIPIGSPLTIKQVPISIIASTEPLPGWQLKVVHWLN